MQFKLKQISSISLLSKQGAMKRQIFIVIFTLALMLSTVVTASTFSSFSNQEKTAQTVKVFPNPVKDVATLQIKLEDESQLKIEFFDLSGKKVKEVKKDNVFGDNYQIKVDVSEFNEGIYFCRITTDQWIKAKRILIRK